MDNTQRSRPFLTARWQNLIVLTYAVPPSLLMPLLPPGCELDTIGDSAFASLVAFEFARTRVGGVAWPGYTAFPEINLRFYVRFGGQRGVAFAREFVGKRLVATVARLIYNEPYRVAPMRSRVIRSADALGVEHRLRLDGARYQVRVTADPTPRLPAEHDMEAFFIEQRWGFGTSRRGELVRYHVVHPPWRVHTLRRVELDWDWGAIYGRPWALLQNQEPYSATLVAGSAVALSPRTLCPAPLAEGALA